MKINEQAITERFVSVYYELKSQSIIDTKREFCKHILITPSNFIFLEKGERYCNIGQMCALVNHWKVNPNWLMTGKGAMFFHPAHCG
jgi:hypothetical protein